MKVLRLAVLAPRCLGALSLLVGAALAVPQVPALALEGPSAATAPGSWEISEAEGTRKCRIMLRPAPGAAARAPLGMPAGCKRAFPFLAKAGAWAVTDDHQLSLEDESGQVILAFAPAEEERLMGRGPDGESYEFEQVGKPRQTLQAPAAPAPSYAAAAVAASQGLSPIRPLSAPGLRVAQRASAPLTEVAANTPAVAAAAAPALPPVATYSGRPADLAGRYIILREEDRDVGCLLTLDGAARGPGGNKAQLAPACRDQGIIVFDPVGWHYERGLLVLRARKGHDLRLQYHADGVWRKDPKEGGKPLGFKKI